MAEVDLKLCFNPSLWSYPISMELNLLLTSSGLTNYIDSSYSINGGSAMGIYNPSYNPAQSNVTESYSQLINSIQSGDDLNFNFISDVSSDVGGSGSTSIEGTLRIEDSSGCSKTFDISESCDWTAEASLPPPDITCPENSTITQSQPSTYTITNNGGAVSTWSISGNPSGVSLSNQTGTSADVVFDNSVAVGTYNIVVNAVNASGSSTCSFVIDVIIASNPRIVCPGFQTIEFMSPSSFTIFGSDLTFGSWDVFHSESNVSVPLQGASMQNQTLTQADVVFDGTTPSGTYVLSIYAYDESGQIEAQCNFTLTVQDSSQIPNLVCPSNLIWIQGNTQTLTLTDTTSSTVNWSIGGSLTGVSIVSQSTGQIQLSYDGTAPVGMFTIIATATNPFGSDTCTIQVDSQSQSSQDSPLIQCPFGGTQTVGSIVTYNISNTGGDAISWSFVGNPNNSGISLQNQGPTSADVIFEVPSGQTSYVITVTATNSFGSDTCTINIDIN